MMTSTTTGPMAQPTFIPNSGSDVCVMMTGHLDEALEKEKLSAVAKVPLSRESSVGEACSALFALKSSALPASDENLDNARVEEAPGASAPLVKTRSSSFDDALVGRVAASNRARQRELMPPPPPRAKPMIVKVKVPRARAPTAHRIALVQRCTKFTTALKAAHPPGSPVFTLFRAFVTHGQNHRQYRQVIVQMADLLRPDPKLLRLFYDLLPSWVFKRKP